MTTLSDSQIEALIVEAKTVPSGLRPLTKQIERNRHLRRDFELTGGGGSSFILATRQSRINPLDFSAILGYKVPGFNTIFRLRRYNGKSHRHTNTLEGDTLNDFHIHYATERYQRCLGAKEDHFAVATERYSNLDSAIECLLHDCGFRSPIEDSPLFAGRMI